MARTIEEIKQDMTARFMQMEAVKSAYGLDGSKGFDDCFSRASLESVLFWVFAACVWAHEKLFDLHRADVEARIALLEPHTLRWYVNKAKAFMWDQTGSVKLQLKQDTDVYDLSGLTDTSEEALAKYRPVKYAVATEDNTIIYIKVAREDETTKSPVKLTDGMLSGLRSYLNEIKDAGVSVVVRNEEADAMQISLLIYYNPMLLTVSGDTGTLTDNSEPIPETVRQVIQNLPFNGTFRKSDLLAALQALPCVEVADIRSVKVKAGDKGEWREVEGYDRPYSGYYSIFDKVTGRDRLTGEYKPYSSVDDV